MVVVQGDELNNSRLATVVCVPLTSQLRWAEAPGNALLPAGATSLPRDSVANSSQILSIDRNLLTDQVGQLSGRWMHLVLSTIDIVLGRHEVF